MTPKKLHEQAVRVDAATNALLDAAMAEVERGEVFSEEEVDEYVDKEYQAWMESQDTAIPA